jgi:predicted small metal-binding protein
MSNYAYERFKEHGGRSFPPANLQLQDLPPSRVLKPDLEVSFVQEFSCGSVVPGCTAVFYARSEKEIVVQVGRHAHEDHGLAELSPELLAQVRRNIRIV